MDLRRSAIDALQLQSAVSVLSATSLLLARRQDTEVDDRLRDVLAAVRDDASELHDALMAAEADWATGSGMSSPERMLRWLSSLNETRSVQAYLRLIASGASLRGDDGSGKPLRVPLSLLHMNTRSSDAGPSSGVSHRGGRDGTEHQAARDVERDMFVVNGISLPGSLVRFSGALATIIGVAQDIEQRVFAASQQHTFEEGLSPALRDALLLRARSIAVQLLRLANRTVSGGDGYEAATRVFVPRSDDGKFYEAVRRWVDSRGRKEGGNSSVDNELEDQRSNSATVSAQKSSPDGWEWGTDTDDDDDTEFAADNSANAGFVVPNEIEPSAHDPLVLLVADSKAAPPIEITIDVGPYQSHITQQNASTTDHAPDAVCTSLVHNDDGGATSSSQPPEAVIKLGFTSHDAALIRDCSAWRVGMRATIKAVTVYRLLDAAASAQAPVASALAATAKHGTQPEAEPGLLGRVKAVYVQRVAWTPDFLALPALQKEEETKAHQFHSGSSAASAEALLESLLRGPASDSSVAAILCHLDASLGLHPYGDAATTRDQITKSVEPVAASSVPSTGATGGFDLLPVICGDGGHVLLEFEPAVQA